MEYVTLRSGLRLPMIGFGTFPLRGEELKAVLRLTAEAGYELYDSAFLYKNEADIGACLKEGILRRESVVLTSKIQGIQYTGRRRWLHLDRVSVRKAYRLACRKFATESLDLYLLHSPFDGYTKAYKELIDLYQVGGVKAIGVSNFDVQQLRALYEACGEYPMLNQIELHPFNAMEEIVGFCQEHDIQVEAYSPFGRGNLVGAIMGNERLKEIGAAHGKTVGQVVLRWIVQQGIVTIPRSTNAGRIRQNLEVFDFALSNREMAYIDSLNQDKSYGRHFQHQ